MPGERLRQIEVKIQIELRGECDLTLVQLTHGLREEEKLSPTCGNFRRGWGCRCCGGRTGLDAPRDVQANPAVNTREPIYPNRAVIFKFESSVRIGCRKLGRAVLIRRRGYGNDGVGNVNRTDEGLLVDESL